MNIPKKILVFDIETIPEERYIPKEENEFPPLYMHKICTIGYLRAFYSEKTKRFSISGMGTKNITTENEKKLLFDFNSFLEITPTLVSYNGCSFDLPVIKLRAIKNGIALTNLYKSNNKWENYQSRYADNWHCDLLNWYGGYNTKYKLNDIAAFLGIPTKIEGMTGASVAQLYKEKKFDLIYQYCMVDVFITYLLFLYKLEHQGVIFGSSKFNSIEDLVEKMKNGKIGSIETGSRIEFSGNTIKQFTDLVESVKIKYSQECS